MELRQYLVLLRKWAWLLILTTSIAASSSYFYSRSIPPTYSAETTLLIGQIVGSPNPNSTDIQTTSNLAQAYALLVTQPPILQATADVIRWPESWQTLYFKISATTVSSQLLRISVTDNDPAQAKQIADELANQLVLKGPISTQQKQSEEQRTFAASQLAQLKLQIEGSQKTLNSLTNQATLENDPKKLDDLNNRISTLQTKITGWQTNYASLSALVNNNASNLFLTVLAPAQEPTTPVSPNIPQNILFAAIAGLVLAGGAILLLEYLDDTVKDAEDTQRFLSLPALGAITRITGIQQPTDHLITMKQPTAPIAEAYRIFRTNLRFTGLENPSGALLVTSAGPGEGKSTTAANLAVTMAQSGRRVILLDTDLRRPSLHKFFGLPNSVGLSNMFLDNTLTIDAVLQPTETENLRIITSGPLPPNPAEVLDSKQMNELLSTLRAQSDMLILDSPPILAVADASILGSRCSGAVLVVDAGRTRTDVCKRATETLKQTGVKVYGVVLNKISARRASGYYYYYYYSQDGARVKRREKGQK